MPIPMSIFSWSTCEGEAAVDAGGKVDDAENGAIGRRRHADLALRPVGGAAQVDGKLAGDPQVRHPIAAGAALLGSDIAVEYRHGLALPVVADNHASDRFGFHLLLL
jgi:hypothetical protein